MNTKLFLSAMALVAASASAQTIQTTQHGDTTIVTVNNPTKNLILPVVILAVLVCQTVGVGL